jgi:hypothetical protein
MFFWHFHMVPCLGFPNCKYHLQWLIVTLENLSSNPQENYISNPQENCTSNPKNPYFKP